MVDSRTATALAGLALSLLVSVVAFVYFNTFLLFLVVPFIPLLFRRGAQEAASPPLKTCPECGFQSADPEFTHCPRDGHRLQE